MPIRPEPMKLTCQICLNKMIFAPHSDFFAMPACEWCGECQWQRSQLTTLERLIYVHFWRRFLK